MANSLGNNGGRTFSFLNRPVLIDCDFVVDSTNGNGLGIRSLKGMGVKNVFMNTSAMPGTNRGYTNPNPAAGYALIELDSNYNKYAGGFAGFIAPTTGSTSVAINSTSLTIGNPYIITSAGVGSAGTATIAPVADVSGSLASTWFRLYDAYGNTFIVWFSVSGVGAAPIGVSGTLVQQTITLGSTAATIGAALVLTIQNLPSGISGVSSFTASGTTTVTVVSTSNMPLAGVPMDGVITTGFTFALTKSKTNLQNWQNVGLPKGAQPLVGASFIAIATGDTTLGTSTGTVAAVGVANINTVQVIGDPNQTIGRAPMGGSPNVGGMLLVQFVAPTSSSVTTPIATAPTNGDVVGMSFLVEQGSIIIDGE